MSIDISKLICKKDKTLIEAWKVINENTKGTVFIVDDQNKLTGILTDGDIRRHLITGGKLEQGIENLLKKEFVYAFNNESYEELKAKTNEKIKIIPIVSHEFHVESYFEFDANFYIPIAIPDLKGNEFNYLTDAFLSTWISSSGEYIPRFESDFSSFCDTEYGIAVANGTVALHLALKTLEIGAGDEVIIPDLTFAATINAVLHANATPVIVDIEEDSWCIDPLEIEKSITKKTRAIIPVHLYGQPCIMDEIMKIASKNNLYVIEDCAQAHGALFNNRKVGSFGLISCFSFYGNKVITTGEGGMCLTNDKRLLEKMRILRDHGMSKEKRYWHDEVGFNYRMTNLQASIGLAQVERIEQILEERNLIEAIYRDNLKNNANIQFQQNNLKNRKKITWLVSGLLLSEGRDELLARARKEGIDIRPFFYPLSEMGIYRKYLFSNKNSQSISKRGINFPTNNSVTEELVLRISELLLK